MSFNNPEASLRFGQKNAESLKEVVTPEQKLQRAEDLQGIEAEIIEEARLVIEQSKLDPVGGDRSVVSKALETAVQKLQDEGTEVTVEDLREYLY